MIFAFIGDNSYAREQAAQEFVKDFQNMHGLVALDKFAGDDLNVTTLIESISTIPFLSTRRLVVVRDFSANKELTDNLDTIVSSCADSTDLLLIESRIDNRSKFRTNIKEVAEVREFINLQGDELVKWVMAQTKKLGGSISYNDAQVLVDRMGSGHQLLASELQKLVLLQPQITLDSIQQLTIRSPQSSVFNMLDAAFSGNTATALKLYAEQRALGMEPEAILGMIGWQLHILCLVKSARDIPADEIAARAKISPFVVRKNLNIAKRLTEKRLVELLDKAIETDKMLKSTAVNSDDAVQSLIMELL